MSKCINYFNRDLQPKLFEKFYEALKPNGYLVITTVNFLRIKNRARMLLGTNPLINPFKRTIEGRNHIREYELQEMVGYIEEAGFVVLKKERWGLYGKKQFLASFL